MYPIPFRCYALNCRLGLPIGRKGREREMCVLYVLYVFVCSYMYALVCICTLMVWMRLDELG